MYTVHLLFLRGVFTLSNSFPYVDDPKTPFHPPGHVYRGSLLRDTSSPLLRSLRPTTPTSSPHGLSDLVSNARRSLRPKIEYSIPFRNFRHSFIVCVLIRPKSRKQNNRIFPTSLMERRVKESI